MIKTCKTCSKQYKIVPSKAEGSKYCSKKCNDIAKKELYRGNKNPAWSSKLIPCSGCDKKIFVIAFYRQRNAENFCSHQCYARWQSKNRRGENAGGWNGGLTPLIKLIRTSLDYKKWRISVFERDNYTCQNCGKVGVKLNADHVTQFAIIIRKFKITSMEQADKCKALWDINNGRTLCEPCHRETDTFAVRAKELTLI